MNIFTLGLRVTDTADTDENKITHVLAESLPSTDKRVATKVQLSMASDHYVGKLLASLTENQTILAIGPTKATPDGVLQMQEKIQAVQDPSEDVKQSHHSQAIKHSKLGQKISKLHHYSQALKRLSDIR